VSLLALFVARKIHEPANERYHLGYAKYEPLMIGLEGTLIAAVCLYAIAGAVKDLVHPEPVDAPWLVIVPFEILRDSFTDLVDANPYTERRNEIARECVARYGLRGLDWVRVRRAGRRLFVLVSFVEAADMSLDATDRVRSRITDDSTRLHPDLDLSVLFRGA
jgi:divalent metal cation (Fe/Co/Zn/Cd) transporter